MEISPGIPPEIYLRISPSKWGFTLIPVFVLEISLGMIPPRVPVSKNLSNYVSMEYSEDFFMNLFGGSFRNSSGNVSQKYSLVVPTCDRLRTVYTWLNGSLYARI